VLNFSINLSHAIISMGYRKHSFENITTFPYSSGKLFPLMLGWKN
jgi:hypothetical protein